VVTNFPGERHRVQISGPLLAEIFLGRVTNWNDPKIQALNSTFALPDQPINVLHRADSSGITYNFTAYLSKVSPEWAEKVGTNKAPKWAVGKGVEGNAQLGQAVIGSSYSIAYLEYGFALEHNLQIASLQNDGGKKVSPTQSTIRSAVDAADWASAPHFNLLLVGVQGGDVWPIAAVTWIVLPRTQRKAPGGQGVADFFRWVLYNGAMLADSMGYTPMPEKVVGLIEASLRKELQ
jgi:phosphate transport system substrate-binding protein